MSPMESISDTSPIEVFYHIWGSENLSHTLLLVYEQLKSIIRSKLYKHSKIWCFVTGNYREEIIKFINQYDFISTILFETDTSSVKYEAFTLDHLHRVAIDNPSHKFLYFHTKGSNSSNKKVQDTERYNLILHNWRSIMDYTCIESWKQRIEDLTSYDTVGCRYGTGPSPHYSGNFWWARGDYLKTLPNIYEYTHSWGDRIKCEMWVCSNNPNHLSVNNDLHNVWDDMNILQKIK